MTTCRDGHKFGTDRQVFTSKGGSLVSTVSSDQSRDEVVHVNGPRPTPGELAREVRDVAVALPLFAAAPLLSPYMRWYAPNDEVNPDPVNHLRTDNYSSLGVIGQLMRALDRNQGVYGAHPHMPVYNTEFGYITSPPKHDNQLEPSGHRYPWVSQKTAAYYINWAEYISWRNPRMLSYEQYLLNDPLPARRSNDWGGFASGLINHGANHIPKPTYYAYRLPLYLPATSARRGQRVEVCGCVRPAHFAILDGFGPQIAEIQFAPVR
jgi:hypothetical protein